MTTPEQIAESTGGQTLSQRLTVGKIPAPETLRYAMQLCDALRRIHEDGRAHGAVSREVVVLVGGSAQLLPGEPADLEALTPYLSPERLQGSEPDACSDIFSFGALLYEMLTAIPAFAGRSRDALPPCIGHQGFDRLISTCLSREPTGRWQRMQQVAMELKLLAASERRAETHHAQRQDQLRDALSNELRYMEARWEARLEQQRETFDGLNRAVAEGHARVDEVCANLKDVGSQVAGLDARLDARLAAALEHLTRVEEAARAANGSVNAQAQDMAGLRAAIGRTEDLVERVVEALEGLQNMVISQAGDDLVK